MYIGNIQKETLKNDNYRKVLHTAKHMQLVVMSLLPDQDIGMEVHPKTDQFIRVEKGNGEAIINNVKHKLKNDSVVIIPAGANHNIINTGNTKMKLYTVYTPPNHKDGLIQKEKPLNHQDGGSGGENNVYYKLNCLTD